MLCPSEVGASGASEHLVVSVGINSSFVLTEHSRTKLVVKANLLEQRDGCPLEVKEDFSVCMYWKLLGGQRGPTPRVSMDMAIILWGGIPLRKIYACISWGESMDRSGEKRKEDNSKQNCLYG